MNRVTEIHEDALNRMWNRGSTGSTIFFVLWALMVVVATVFTANFWVLIVVALLVGASFGVVERKVQRRYVELEIAQVVREYRQYKEETEDDL